MALESGTQLGHYEITEQVGKGGMGEVYRSRDTKLGREVAIKVLPAEFARDDERLARMEREARMLAALNHPNVGGIYGLEQSDGTRFLVLEFVEGETLADRLKRGAIPVEESLEIALQIAGALEAAHEKGVIHRDLKPANIKITPDGRVKVLDFGLAKAFIGAQADVNLSNSPTLSMAATQAGLILGTAAYMSPEQASGEVADHRADVWAFGVVLFEMLTGRQLFTGKTASHVMGAVLERAPEWSALPANLHPRVRILLERLLEKNAKDRLSGISDARVEIQRVFADPDGVLTKPSAQVSGGSYRSVWLAAGLAGIVLAGVAGWNLRPEQPGPVSRFSQDWPDAQPPRSTGRSVLAFSADGTAFVFNTFNGLYLRAMAELEPRLIPGTEPGSANPFLSPDGDNVGYYSATDQALMRISVNGGAPVRIAPAGAIYGASWGADDVIVFATAEGIFRVPATGGDPEPLISTGDGQQAYGPEMLPSGWVLFSLAAGLGAGIWDEAQIVIESPESGERRVLVEGGSDARYVPTGHLVYAFGNSLFARPFDLGSLETGGPVEIANGLVRAAAAQTGTANYGFSTDGTLIQLYGETPDAVAAPPTGIYYADRGGVLDRIDLRANSYSHPRVSRDGRQLAVQSTDAEGDTEVWVYDLEGGSEIFQLTQGGNSSRPIWTPDGQHITFLSTRDGTPSIWWRLANGSAPAEQLSFSEGPEHWPEAWSPDGDTLVYTSFEAGVREEQNLVALSPATGDTEVFVHGYSAGASFSPEGNWIAYQATRPDNMFDAQLFLKPFPSGGAERQLSQNGGTYPVFTSNGRELFYRRPVLTEEFGLATPTELVRRSLTIDEAVRFGEESILPIQGLPTNFGVRDFDVMPDGRLILMLPDAGVADATEESPLEFRVVQNWFEELKERVPVP